jgi:hypothetical protein
MAPLPDDNQWPTPAAQRRALLLHRRPAGASPRRRKRLHAIHPAPARVPACAAFLACAPASRRPCPCRCMCAAPSRTEGGDTVGAKHISQGPFASVSPSTAAVKERLQQVPSGCTATMSGRALVRKANPGASAAWGGKWEDSDGLLAHLCLASASCLSPSSEQRTLTDSPEGASRTTARSDRSDTFGSSAITCTDRRLGFPQHACGSGCQHVTSQQASTPVLSSASRPIKQKSNTAHLTGEALVAALQEVHRLPRVHAQQLPVHLEFKSINSAFRASSPCHSLPVCTPSSCRSTCNSIC